MKKSQFRKFERFDMTNASKQHLDQLTGLRYFAALLVFVSHLRWEDSNDFFQKIFESGYVGVSFFFVLSGFVLSYSYQEKLIKGDITFKRYLFLRFARLTPLHFATALPFIGVAIYSGRFNILELFLNLSYLQSWIPHSSVYFSFNAPSWSLSNEMFFYVCFFFVATTAFHNLRRICAGLLLTVVVSAVLVTVFFDGQKTLGSNNTLAHWMFYIFPGFRILEFLCGIVLFRLWKVGYLLKPYYVGPAYFLLFIAMYFANTVPEAFRMSLYFLPIIVFFLFAHLHGEGPINRILNSRAMVLLGNASFAFYLIHQPLIGVFKRLLSRFKLGDLVFSTITLVSISLLSIAVYLIYEKWAERKMRELALKFS